MTAYDAADAEPLQGAFADLPYHFVLIFLVRQLFFQMRAAARAAQLATEAGEAAGEAAGAGAGAVAGAGAGRETTAAALRAEHQHVAAGRVAGALAQYLTNFRGVVAAMKESFAAENDG